MARKPLVEIRNLTRRYLAADRSVAIEVMAPAIHLAPGERLALVAPSGAGKTTLLNLLLLALRPTAADRFVIRVSEAEDIDIPTIWAKKDDGRLGALRAELMSFVLQTGGLLPFLTARENICLPQRLAGRPVPTAALDEIAGALGIGRILDKRPARLSGGERQRVAVARALLGHPPLLIADEPTASLDRSNAETLLGLITDLCKDYGTCLVLATHDTGIVERFGLEKLGYSSGMHPEGHTVSAFWRDGSIKQAA